MRVTVDFESYYDSDYTLNRLSPAEYILDPRFELSGATIRWDSHPLDGQHGAAIGQFESTARWVDAHNLADTFNNIPWNRVALVSHNTPFDGLILSTKFGHVPALYIDTLAMSRAFVFAFTGRASLSKVADHLGLPPKGTEIENMRGWNLARLRADAAMGGTKFANFKRYAVRDADLASWVLDKLGPLLPRDEWVIMDMVCRMVTTPQLTLDRTVLKEYYRKVVDRKTELMASLRAQGILDDENPRTDLQSNERFANLLRERGVDPPTKISLTTGKETYAFAKTDQDFTALEEHEDDVVQALVAARLGIKSTQEETRTARFLNVSNLAWPEPLARACAENGAPALVRTRPTTLATPNIIVRDFDPDNPPMPFPLRYSGAHTHRLSGDWSWNLQNLQRPNADLDRKAELRSSLCAPPGYVIVSADASQIEARVVATLARCMELIEGFAAGQDVYSTFAGYVYDRTINKKDHPIERFVGKTGVLGLGFGMGAPKFVTTCWNQGRKRIELSLGQRVVNTYRTRYHQVPTYWDKMDRLILNMINGINSVEGPIATFGDRILLPNGMWLYYNGIQQKPGKRVIQRGNVDVTISSPETTFKYGNQTKYLFGGKLTENIVQALARIITMSAAVRLRREWGVRHHLALQIHDQLGYVVPEREGEAMAHMLVHAMRIPPPWLPDLPLEAEAGIGRNLRDLKDIKVPRIPMERLMSLKKAA